MGCPICLDAFGSDDDRGKRPVALPCGHVFHRECSDSWLSECRKKNHTVGCPICKKDLGSSHALPLWPSDVDDLDVYMQNRKRRIDIQKATTNDHVRQAPAAQALDRYMSRDAQGALLGKLMDFRQHINAYIMSVNNVSMSTHGGQDRIFRLFNEVTKAPAINAEFRDAIKALSTATESLAKTMERTEALHSEEQEKTAKAREHLEKAEMMRRSFQKHMETKLAEEQRMHEEKNRADLMRRHLASELRDVERRKESLEKERLSLKKEMQERANEVTKMRVEAAQLAAKCRGEAEVEVQRVTDYMHEQERLRIEAEAQHEQSQSKAKYLADRLKSMNNKLDNSRKENKRLKADLDELRSKAEVFLRSADQNNNSKGKAKAEDDSHSSTPGEDNESNEGNASSSSHQDVVTASRNIDELRKTLSQTSSSQQNSGKVTIDDDEDDDDDSSIIIEGDDIERELDDDDYPMPVLIRNNRLPNQVRGSYNSWSGISGGLMLPTGSRESTAQNSRSSLRRSHTEISIDDEDPEDDSIQFISVKRQNTGRLPSMNRSESALSNSLPSNATLIDRVMRSGRRVLGSTRRR